MMPMMKQRRKHLPSERADDVSLCGWPNVRKATGARDVTCLTCLRRRADAEYIEEIPGEGNVWVALARAEGRRRRAAAMPSPCTTPRLARVLPFASLGPDIHWHEEELARLDGHGPRPTRPM